MPNQPPIFYKNPSIATILSFFWMGLGQIYKRADRKGGGVHGQLCHFMASHVHHYWICHYSGFVDMGHGRCKQLSEKDKMHDLLPGSNGMRRTMLGSDYIKSRPCDCHMARPFCTPLPLPMCVGVRPPLRALSGHILIVRALRAPRPDGYAHLFS
jgi:hypothetical protein